ncbi:MAG: hypothetical protein II239_04610 [Peptococcaceae bacterium]|nr:hypothetical protein [Peptococcaceae bacterium]
MRELFSFIYDLAISPLGLPLEPLHEWIVLLIIGYFAYCKAFSFVGHLYRGHWIHSRLAGSFLHWTIRFFLFFAVWAVAYGTITVGKFAYAHWVGIALLISLCVAGYIIIKCTKKAGESA